jgi:hypothetical protein
MKTKTLITAFAKMAAIAALVATSHAITIGDTVGTGGSAELGGVPFVVDYGSVEYVSDLSNGALRFDGIPLAINTSISNSSLVINRKTELAFDWSVTDQSDMADASFFTINDVKSTFHDGIGEGLSSGTVFRFVESGSHDLSIKSSTTNLVLCSCVQTVGNLRLNPLNPVPDSPLGFFGIATIFAVLGLGRRFSGKKAS